eukprot:31085-Pelagococcus_subviridis.AAC.18
MLKAKAYLKHLDARAGSHVERVQANRALLRHVPVYRAQGVEQPRARAVRAPREHVARLERRGVLRRRGGRRG